MASAMEALVLYPATHKTAVVDVPKPMPGPGEVLVRIHAVALNPVDSIYVTHPLATQKQRVLGTDFAGVVEAVGPSPIPNSPAVGTRVAGFVQGACSVNELPGAFAQYVALPADLVWTVPKAMSLESASTISMCGLTAAQGVFARLRLPAPFPVPDVHKAKTTTNADPVNILVYAASTSLGMYIAQCLHASEKASGRKIRMIGTASQSKHALLNAPPYSYDAVIDYRHKDWPKMVREATTGGNGVQYAIDCISEGATVSGVESTFEASIQGEGHFATFRGPGGAGGGYDVGSLKVKPTYGAVWEGQGVEVDYGVFKLAPNAAAKELAVEFYRYLSSQDGNFVPNPVRLMPGGLDKIVPDGFALLGSNMVSARDEGPARTEAHMKPISGEKLVYVIEEE